MIKREMPVGQKVRGYGLLNEYGEFDFIPEQTGVRKGQTKVVLEENCIKVSETKGKILVHLSLEKTNNKLAMMNSLLNLNNKVIEIIQKYDFV